MSLSEKLRQFCHRHGLKLNKDLGQHFLTDQTILDAIMDAAQVRQEDRIVEIGPGIGVLTAELLKKTANVTVIEIDERFPPLIKKYLSESGSGIGHEPAIILENALNVPFPEEPYKIVANIPYHITSPLLRHAFMESTAAPQSLTLLIQREVAENICDVKNAGLLTIIVGLFGTPRLVRLVPPECFLPPPKVDSAVLHIDGFAEPIASKETIERVMKLAKLGFSQKRKMLRNTLGSLPNGAEMMEKAEIDPTRRPQTLSVSEWIRLAETQTGG